MRYFDKRDVVAMGTKLLLVIACLAAGCARYEAAPITRGRVEKDLSAPMADDLKIATRELKHSKLKPLAVDLREGLSPEEAAVVAVIVNPSLRAERDRRDVAGAQLVQAGLLPNPQLAAAVGFPHGNAPPDSFTAYSVGANWDITSLIGHDARKQAARAEADSVALDVAWKEWQVAQAARLAVYQVLSAEKQLQLARQLDEELRETRDVVRQAVEAHLKTSLDLSGAQTAWLEARAAALELQRAAADRRLALNKALGLPPEMGLKLKEGGELPRVISANEQEESNKSLEVRRLDLLALKKGYESQDATFRATVLGQFPKVNVGFTEARDNSNVKSSSLGVTIDLPIFDRNQAVIAQEKATRRKLYDEYVNRVFEARSEVATAIAGMGAVEEEIRANELALPAMERLEADYRAAMNQRSVDVLSYYTVRTSVTQKKIDAIKLRQELVELGIALELASGGYIEERPSHRLSPGIQGEGERGRPSPQPLPGVPGEGERGRHE
jgi:cobalt-zinc-cadmium efflux system outer membrane protein